MMPVYRYMDSYPHQRNQTGYQTFPSYMPIDPPKSPMVYEPWPNGGSYGYPMPSHSCCNHGNVPNFHGFRPPYPQPMPSPAHYCGGYTMPYPEAYPVYYVPPSHYSAELPGYEFDKNMPGRYHCCGCPNHPCHQKGESTLRIEEQEPDVVGKRANDPVQTKNYPYPVVWIPQEYVKERRRPFEPEVEEQESYPHKINKAKRKVSHDQEPKIWNGWLPFDVDYMKYLMNGGDGKRGWDQRNEEQKKDFQFPVIWMPSCEGRREEGGKIENKDVNGGWDQKNEDQMGQIPFPIVWLPPQDKKQEESKGKDGKEANASSNISENPPYTFKFVPMRYLDDANNMENSKVNEENIACKNDIKMKAAQRNIPVKHVDPRNDEEKLEETKKRDRVVPVKQADETDVSKPSGDNNKKQSSSSPRSSKLPPVCLRVDHLPKKKNGSSSSPSPKKNGSSRSPSPPGLKECSEQKLDNTMKASVQLKENMKQASIESTPADKEVETEKKEAKEIMVAEKTSDAPKDSAQLAMHTNAEVSEKSTTEETAETKEATDLASASNERKLERKTLSEVEAAVRIQSAYRGFEMRRSEPIKKLKQIAEVHDQVAGVRNHIQALEASSDAQKDDKQELLIGETIMRLLLKLDTIQGLHPSLRDIRNPLAKELVTLQEKLDTLTINKPKQPKEQVCPIQPAEPLEAKINKCRSNQEEREETGSSESSDIIQSSGDHKLPPAVDSNNMSKGEEALLSPSDNIANGQELLVASDLKPEEHNLEAIMEHNDEVNNGMSGACAKEFLETEEVNAPELKQDGEFYVKEDENNSIMPANIFEAIDETRADDNQETMLDELLVNAIDEEDDEHQKDKQVETENTTAYGAMLDELPVNAIDEEDVEHEKDKEVEMESTTAYGPVSSEVTLPADTEGLMATQEEAEMNELAELPEMNELAELPVGTIDDDSASSVQAEKNADLPGKESDFQGTTGTTLPEDNTLNEFENSGGVLEEKPKVETAECMKLEDEESQKLPAASLPGVGAGQMEDKGVEVHNERSFLYESQEFQSVISMADERSQNVLSDNDHPAADTARGKEVPIDKNGEPKHLPLFNAEEVKETEETKIQTTNQLESASLERTNDVSDGSKIANNNLEVSAGAEFTPLSLQAEHEGESLLASPTCSQMSTDECDMEVKNNKHLMEENEKRREMVEKLIEAGKQQLNVISNLNGRIKDLERKLSRRRKLRTKQNRSSACGASRLKRSNVDVKERAVGVAM